jgi:hypothetical protein
MGRSVQGKYGLEIACFLLFEATIGTIQISELISVRLPESSHLIQQIVGVNGAAPGRAGGRIFLRRGCLLLIAFFRGLGLFLLDLGLHLLKFQLQFLNLLRLRFRVVFAHTFVAQLFFNVLQLLFQLAD